MKKQLNRDALLKMTAVVNGLMYVPYANSPEGGEIQVAFAAGALLPKNDHSQAIEMGKEFGRNVVFLQFEPGRELKGPSRIHVFGLYEGDDFQLFADCVLWAPDERGPLYLVCTTERVTFSFNGFNLVGVADRPEGLVLKRGINFAKAILRRAARLDVPLEVGRTIYTSEPNTTKH